MKEMLDKALEHFKKQEWDKAIDEFSKILEKENTNAEIYNNIALCYTNKGEEEKAEKFYLKALGLNPKLPQVYINLVDNYYKQKMFTEALDLLQMGVQELPENMVLRHYLARIYMADSQLDLAIDELDKVLDAQPENYDAYYDLGQVYFQMGNYDSAIENFENVLQYKDDNDVIYFYLAQAYEANDEIDKALSNYLKAIATNDVFYPAYKKAAIIFMARGDKEDAIEYFEDYLKFNLPEEEKKSINEVISRLKK